MRKSRHEAGKSPSDETPAVRLVLDVLDTSGTAVVAVDRDEVIRYANPGAHRLFGYADDGLVGRAVTTLIPGDVTASGRPARATYLERPDSAGSERTPRHVARRLDGSEFAVEVSLTSMDTAAGPWTIVSVVDASRRSAAEVRVRQRARDYLTQGKINEAVARAQDPQGLLQGVCDAVVTYGTSVGAWFLARSGSEVEVQARSGPLATRLAVIRFEASQPEAGGAGFPDPRVLEGLMTAAPLFFNTRAEVPEEHRYLADAFGVESLAAVPLISQGRTLGVLALAALVPDLFNRQAQAMLGDVATNVSIALDRFEARSALEAALAQRNELLKRLVEAQERERERIAADVHDEPVQTLASIDLRLGLLGRRLEERESDLATDLKTIHGSVQTVADQLRNLLFELEPIDERTILSQLLQDAAAHIFDQTGIGWRVEPSHDPAESQLSVALRTKAIRIAKEAMANVVKHSRATEVVLSVGVADEGVTVRIRDNGVGLPATAQQPSPGHRGIRGMRDRASVIGGRLDITDASPGTVVELWMPLH